MSLKIPGVTFTNPIPENATVRPMSAAAYAESYNSPSESKNFNDFGNSSFEHKNYSNPHDEKPVGGGGRRGGGGNDSSDPRDDPEHGNNEYDDDFDRSDSPRGGKTGGGTGGGGGIDLLAVSDRKHRREHDPVALQTGVGAPRDGGVYMSEEPYDNNDDTGGIGGGGSMSAKKATQTFPEGEHPLEGVPDLDLSNLPDPDPFSIKAKYVLVLYYYY